MDTHFTSKHTNHILYVGLVALDSPVQRFLDVGASPGKVDVGIQFVNFTSVQGGDQLDCACVLLDKGTYNANTMGGVADIQRASGIADGKGFNNEPKDSTLVYSRASDPHWITHITVDSSLSEHSAGLLLVFGGDYDPSSIYLRGLPAVVGSVMVQPKNSGRDPEQKLAVVLRDPGQYKLLTDTMWIVPA